MRKLRSKHTVFMVTAASTLLGLYLAMSWVQSAGRTVDVVVAARDIPPFATIQVTDLKVMPYLAAATGKNTFRRPEEVQGRMTRSVIPAGVPITPVFLTGEGEERDGGGLAKSLRDANRPGAFSLQFNLVDAAAGHVAPGDRVDIVLTYRPDPTKGSQVEVIPEALVLNVLKPTTQQTQASGGGTMIIIFSADKQFAERLAQAKQAGAAIALRLLPAQGGTIIAETGGAQK